MARKKTSVNLDKNSFMQNNEDHFYNDYIKDNDGTKVFYVLDIDNPELINEQILEYNRAMTLRKQKIVEYNNKILAKKNKGKKTNILDNIKS